MKARLLGRNLRWGVRQLTVTKMTIPHNYGVID
jgi:hypothetical protein